MPMRGRRVDFFIVDEAATFFPEPMPVRMPLKIVERNGRWHVYATATEPWALVTAFRTKEEALAYVETGTIHAGAVDVQVGPWVAEVLQEDRNCIVCFRTHYAGSEVHVRSIRVSSEDLGDSTKYEVKCLEHTRTRFNRDDPI